MDWAEHTQKITILDPELKEMTKLEEQKFNLPSKVNPADLFNAFINVNFQKSGVYWIKIELDGKLTMSYPLPVFESTTKL